MGEVKRELMAVTSEKPWKFKGSPTCYSHAPATADDICAHLEADPDLAMEVLMRVAAILAAGDKAGNNNSADERGKG